MLLPHFSYYIDLKYICQFVWVCVCLFVLYRRPNGKTHGHQTWHGGPSRPGECHRGVEVDLRGQKDFTFVQQRGHFLLVII